MSDSSRAIADSSRTVRLKLILTDMSAAAYSRTLTGSMRAQATLCMRPVELWHTYRLQVCARGPHIWLHRPPAATRHGGALRPLTALNLSRPRPLARRPAAPALLLVHGA